MYIIVNGDDHQVSIIPGNQGNSYVCTKVHVILYFKNRTRSTLTGISRLILYDFMFQTKQHGPWDKRLEYISGFTGESGQGVVTQTTAVLWTEAKYWERADSELSGTEWTLCRTDFTGVSLRALHLAPDDQS